MRCSTTTDDGQENNYSPSFLNNLITKLKF